MARGVNDHRNIEIKLTFGFFLTSSSVKLLYWTRESLGRSWSSVYFVDGFCSWNFFNFHYFKYLLDVRQGYQVWMKLSLEITGFISMVLFETVEHQDEVAILYCINFFIKILVVLPFWIYLKICLHTR